MPLTSRSCYWPDSQTKLFTETPTMELAQVIRPLGLKGDCFWIDE